MQLSVGQLLERTSDFQWVLFSMDLAHLYERALGVGQFFNYLSELVPA